MLFGHVKRSDGFKHKVAPITDASGQISGSSWASLRMFQCCSLAQRGASAPASPVREQRRPTQTDLLRLSSAFVSEDDRTKYVVKKRNRHGYAGKRQLYLQTGDGRAPSVQLYDAAGRLRKEYPLHLLAQMEASPTLQCALSLHFHGAADTPPPPTGEEARPLSPSAGGMSPTAGGGTGVDVKPAGLKGRAAENKVLNVTFETAELLHDFVSKCTGAVQQMQQFAREASSGAPTPRRQLSGAGSGKCAPPHAATTPLVSNSIAQKLASRALRAKSNLKDRTGAAVDGSGQPGAPAELAQVMAELGAQRLLLQQIMARLDAQ